MKKDETSSPTDQPQTFTPAPQPPSPQRTFPDTAAGPPDVSALEKQISDLKAQCDQFQAMELELAQKYAAAHDNELVLQSALTSAIDSLTTGAKVDMAILKRLAEADLSKDTKLRTTPPM